MQIPFISDVRLVTFFQMDGERALNFDAEKRRPYLFNSAPFSNKNSAQQGYLTSEPYSISKEIGVEPNVFLLADYGFDTYQPPLKRWKAQ